MQERPENINAAADDTEATLVAPRFDDEEARRAHPVVPLAEGGVRAPFVNARPRTRRGLRRSWPPALIVVALLVSAAVGGAVATSVFRGQRSNADAVQAPPALAPAQTVEAPSESPSEAQTPPATADSRADQTPPRTRAVRDGEEEEARAASVPVPARRVDDKKAEGIDEERRGHGRDRENRRARDEDEVEKEMRKALKHAKGKAPRLVDVLVNP